MEEASKVARSADWRDNVTWYLHETPFCRLVKRVGSLFFGAAAEISLIDFDNIPATGRCIMASNHISNLDVIYLGVFAPRHPHFMAKAELYKNPILGWSIRQCGSFPVHRGENDTWALRQAGKILEAEKVLCMFPEGTRSKEKAQMRRGKVGAVRLALEHHAPIIPIAISGTHNFGFKGWRGNKIKIQAGQPLDMSALVDSAANDGDTLRRLTTVLMQHIAAMLPPAHRGVYG
jgi:1-acyl-sn-glycerol-3-phosphate acyltransferase